MTDGDNCEANADAIFLFDDSSSISHNNVNNFQMMKEFMKNIVDRFSTVGSEGTQFGAVMFSDRVQGHFDLNDFNTHAAIKQGIQSIQPSHGGATAIGSGLKVLRIL